MAEAVTRLASNRFPSPLGEIVVLADGDAVCALDFGDCAPRVDAFVERHYAGADVVPDSDPAGLRAILGRYFAGDFAALGEVKVRLTGTAFQRSVWQTLRQIPPGCTETYGQLARAIGKPRAPRAVGHANGANPLAIVIPCHRLVAADGGLIRYGGGLWRKRWLIDHERRQIVP